MLQGPFMTCLQSSQSPAIEKHGMLKWPRISSISAAVSVPSLCTKRLTALQAMTGK